jgi:Tol biopolymer transport system component
MDALNAMGRLRRVMAAFRTMVVVGLLLFSAAKAGAEPTIVFSVKEWTGDYVTSNSDGSKNTVCTGSIWAVDLGTGDVRAVAAPGSQNSYPQPSRDGQWLYFQGQVNGHWDVFRCRASGAELQNITRPVAFNAGKECFGTQLSGDGKKVVYTSHDGTLGKATIMNSDGSDPHYIGSTSPYFYMAALNYDGSKVVYADASANYSLMIADQSGGGTQCLVRSGPHGKCVVPRFSPDGKSIIFLKTTGDVFSVTSDVFSIGIDGANLKQLTRGNHYDVFFMGPHDEHGSSDAPDISCDGKKIAYIAMVQGVAQVFTVNSDGSSPVQITHRKTNCGRVKWSPDGKQLAFVSFEGIYPQLFVVDSAGGEPKQFTHLKAAVYFINWLPQAAVADPKK